MSIESSTRAVGELAGVLWSLNSVLILVFVPIVTAFTRKVSAFRVIMIGSFVTALGPFLFAIGPSTPVQIFAIVLLTIGEALWSPRSHEYNVSIAPKGREATYVSLAVLPYFLAKFFVAMISGRLLTAYCPPQGERHSSIALDRHRRHHARRPRRHPGAA